jgi:putative FmdB family regulatory protein
MPLYEYACPSCEAEFELLVRGDERPRCPTCDSPKLERLLSVPAAHSAGSRELPMSGPSSAGGCGLPQCGSGGCMGMG